jgi:hypothetical protein
MASAVNLCLSTIPQPQLSSCCWHGATHIDKPTFAEYQHDLRIGHQQRTAHDSRPSALSGRPPIRNFLSLDIDLPARLACLLCRPYLLQSTPSSDNGHHVVSETQAMMHSWDWPMVFSPGVSIIHATISTAADQHTCP